MITHESYRDENGWLSPEDVVRSGEGYVRRDNGQPVQLGRLEKMSKSKRNTVSPTAIIERFGADTARWFVLSDSPPERDMEWTESGVAASARFGQRLYRLVQAVATQVPQNAAFAEGGRSLRQATHRSIKAVTEALENLRQMWR